MSGALPPSSFLTGSPAATRSTSWPRRSSSSETRPTNSLTALRVLRRWGETWAIERRSSGTASKDKSPPEAGPLP